MANLNSQNIGLNYKGILNLNTLNGNLSGTLQAVTDGDGNASPLQLSTTQVAVSGNSATNAATTSYFIYDASANPNARNYAISVSALAYGDLNFMRSNTLGGEPLSGTSVGKFDLNGNFSIGLGATAASARLHVRGDGTNPIARFDNNSGTQVFGFANNGDFSAIRVILGAASYFQVSSNAINYLGGASGSTNAHLFQLGVSPYNATSGTQNFISTDVSFAAGAGSANFRPLNLAYTINNSGAQTGTATGIFLNATETALNGMGHNLLDLQVDNSSKARISNVGTLNLSGNIFANGYIEIGASAAYYYSGRSYITSPSDGTLALFSNSGSTFGRLQLGGTTNAFPAIKRNSAGIDFRLADDSAFCNVRCNTLTPQYIDMNNTGIYNGEYFSLAFGAGSMGASGLFVGSGGLVASAILQANSTTKGFLPPRQTQAERTAIASPAIGLIVYQTDTVEGLYVFKSTGWTFIA
jgi:hypothetical protein